MLSFSHAGKGDKNRSIITGSIQSARLSLQSSQLASPPAPSLASECWPPPLWLQGGDTLSCGLGGGRAISEDGTDTLVLKVYMYDHSTIISIIWELSVHFSLILTWFNNSSVFAGCVLYILRVHASLKMDEYSTRVVQEGDHRCKKSTLNDLINLSYITSHQPAKSAGSCAVQRKTLGWAVTFVHNRTLSPATDWFWRKDQTLFNFVLFFREFIKEEILPLEQEFRDHQVYPIILRTK